MVKNKEQQIYKLLSWFYLEEELSDTTTYVDKMKDVILHDALYPVERQQYSHSARVHRQVVVSIKITLKEILDEDFSEAF